MKRRWKLFLGLLIPLLVVVLSVLYMSGEPDIEKDSWLWVQLGSELPDRSEESSLLGPEPPPSLLGLRVLLRRAKNDRRIDGCILDLGGGVAAHRCEELCRILDQFVLGAGGKPLTVVADTLDASSWIVASHGTKIVLHPAGSLDLRSSSAMVPFFGGALRKLGIEPDILRHGEHKAIYEQFANSEPTPELQRELQEMHDDSWRELRQLCARRGLDSDDVFRAAEVGPMSPPQALDGMWIDAIQEDVAVLEEFREQHIALVPTEVYRQVSAATVGIDGDAAIAVLSIEGTLAATPSDSVPLLGKTQGIEALRRGIEEIRAADNVKGVIVKIDSPGGDAFTSEQVWQALTRLGKDYPLVALMGAQATSGGYYAAVATPAIFAHPSTVTGSIGIVGLRFRPTGLLQSLGVHTHVVREAVVGAPAGWVTEDAESRQHSQKSLNDAYELFVGRVSQGRSALTDERVREVADGRVYRGREALELGLVDGIGGWQQAWQRICTEAGELDPAKTQIEVFPRSRSLLEQLRNVDPTALSVAPEALIEPLCRESRWYLGPMLGW